MQGAADGSAALGAGWRPDLERQAPLARMDAGDYRVLGGFRLLLALMVTLQHFQYLLPAENRVVFHHFGFGVVAVAVFFVISGFIVAEANATFYRGRPRAFLLNRVLRLVPPYMAALAISVGVHAALWHAGRLQLWDYALQRSPLDPALLAGSGFALLPGFHTRYVAQDFEFIPFVWSLRVEMGFYLAAFAAYLAIGWAGRAGWAGRTGATLGPAVGAAALGLGFGLFGLFLIRHGPGLLSDLPCFLLGVSAFLLVRRPSGGNAALVLLAGLATFAGFASWQQRGYPIPADQLPLLLLLLGVFALLLLLPQIGPGWRRLDRRLGELSYPLYLNHYAVGIVLYDLVPGRGPGLYLGGTVLSLALAAAMNQAVEAPLKRLRAHIRGARL